MPLEVAIKLGGCAITDKNTFETFDLSSIEAAAKVVSKLVGKCVLIHGAGSFGHFQAHKYGIAKGLGDDPIRGKAGFVKTRLSVTKLLHKVCEVFVEQGIPAVALSQIVKEQRPNRVVFLTNVDGVFDRPPEKQGAKLLDHIGILETGEVNASIGTSLAFHDVTGGIMGKIQTAVNIIKSTKGQTGVFVTKIGSQGSHDACINGSVEKGQGTSIGLCETAQGKNK
ncbi:isopentenyl phosphate kinase isoform X2 [Nematostella vectensis]|uniref:isopentenyl phosphate kinase isoform X2 n=1 Tax=Nematostella vectensis TaxID=45351 RepID=UPI002077839B|nr:isopentenyl phosphate kinase isoform X2 [Nematostella vectensis]